MKLALLIAPDFYDYPLLIKQQLENRGYMVHLVYDEDIEIKQDELKDEYFDLLFVIKGRYVDFGFVKNLHANYKLLYQWDCINNFDYRKLSQAFDDTYTFDFKDSRKENIKYVPLFYKKNNIDYKKDIDLLFVGFWKDDRYRIIKKIEKQLRHWKNPVVSYLHIYCPLDYYLKLIIKRKVNPSRIIITKPISPLEMNKLYQRARCVVDINSSDQTGLTIRTFESLGNGIKLITTNENIQDTEFYNKKNVSIIDRNNPIIEEAFITTPYDNNQLLDMNKYEISNWLDNFDYFKGGKI